MLSEYKIYSHHQAHHGSQMVPMKLLALKEHIGNDAKHQQGDNFLYHLELHQRERTAVPVKANAVGRHLAAIVEEGNEPRKSNHADQGPVGTDPCLGQFEMTIPSQCHEDIAHNQ